MGLARRASLASSVRASGKMTTRAIWKSRKPGSNTAWHSQCVQAAIIPARTGRCLLRLSFDLQASKPDHHLERPVHSGKIDVLLAGVKGEVLAAVDRDTDNRLVLGVAKA